MREATKEERESINNYIKSISQKAIIIPEGATNGDMIKALFPNLGINSPLRCFDEDWWNALYRAESEG